MTRGTQDGGLGVAIKHFAANNRESNRNDVDSRISERALREIYLKGFEITVKEGAPWTVMSSYNFLNGQETSERYDLLTKILREEWGFDGLVMTDWGNNSFFWKEIKAGNNLKMPGGNPEDLVKAYEKGLLSRGDLEKNAVVILETIMKTNTFQARAVSPAYQSIAKYNTTRLDAIDYAWISSGIRPENCEDPDTWQDLGSLYEGEWISYNLDIAAEGAYKIACRLAAYGGGAFDIYIDDEKVGAFQNTINTDGWQNWRTAAPFQLELPAGRHTLKLVITQSGMNLQWLEFTSPLSAYTVSGKVEAGETGMEDVSGLEIHAFDKADQAFAHPLAKGTTDAGGNFELEPVLPNGKYMLRIEGAAGKYKELTAAVDVADGNLIGLVLTLEKDQAAPLKGDVNGDGKINISDVMGLCKVLARKAADIPPTPDEIERGDLTGDGEIEITDVMAVCKIIASKV